MTLKAKKSLVSVLPVSSEQYLIRRRPKGLISVITSSLAKKKTPLWAFSNCLLSFLGSPNVPLNAKWAQSGVTVAGGNGRGGETNQLYYPQGLCVDDEDTVIVADCWNHRIVEWKRGATSGTVLAGGNGEGNRTDQLNQPTDVIFDKENDSLIICDSDNRRVTRWPRRKGTRSGETIVDNIDCRGLTMDDEGITLRH